MVGRVGDEQGDGDVADGRRVGLELRRRGFGEILHVALADEGREPGVAVVEPVEEFALGRVGGGVGHGRRPVPVLRHLGVGGRRARIVEQREQGCRVRVEVGERPRGVVDHAAGLLGHARFGDVFDGLRDQAADHRVDIEDPADGVVGGLRVHRSPMKKPASR